MIRPAYLNKGDKVAVLGTGHSVSSSQELKPTLQLMEDWGLVPVMFENANGMNQQLNEQNIRAVLHVNADHGMVILSSNY